MTLSSARFSALLVLPLALACGGGGEEEGSGGLGEDFKPVTAQDLANKSFELGPGSGFFDADDPRNGQSSTLTIGSFYYDAKFAGFAIRSADGSVQGGVVTLGSCRAETLYLHLAGQAPLVASGGNSLASDYYAECGIDSQGRLGLFDEDEERVIVSGPVTAPNADLIATVALSPNQIVDCPVFIGDRSETADVKFELFGNVLTYTANVKNLSAADKVRDGRIHRGAAGTNGELLMTFFGGPIQPVRAYDPPFMDGTSLTASVFVTPEESSVLIDSATPLYVTIHTQKVSSGLLRGQLRD